MRESKVFLFFKKFYFELSLFLISAVIVFLDLFSKKVVKGLFLKQCDAFFLKPYKVNLFYKCKIEISDFLKFSYVENHGLVFGVFSDFKYMKYVVPFLMIFPIFFIFKMIYDIHKNVKFSLKEKRIQMLFLVIILGGGFANIIDRFLNGFVFDFIDVYYKSFHWYTFNVGDCFICIGIAGIALFDIFGLKKKKIK